VNVRFTLVSLWSKTNPDAGFVWDCCLMENGYIRSCARGDTQAEAEANVRAAFARRMADLDALVIAD